MKLLPSDTVRLAVRRLLKQPGVTLASVLALAFGIGAAAAGWSLLSSVLLHPLPVSEPDRLYLVEGRFTQRSGDIRISPSHVYPVYQALRESGAFEQIAAGGPQTLLVTERGAIPQPRTIYFASHDFFSTLGVGLTRGRTFGPGDDRRGAPVAAVISDRYWRSVFDADPQIVGQTVEIRGQAADAPTTIATIIGVAPRTFRGLNLAEAPDLYLPLHTIAGVAGPGWNYFAEPIGTPPVRSSPLAWIRIVGRLKPGEAPAAVIARLDTLEAEGRPLADRFQLTNLNTAAIPEAARPGMVQFTRLLSITVGLLLLIGCVTVGMLLLVRTEDRREELAVCLALGGSRIRLARGIAIEGALLAALGAALAVPVAAWLFAGIRAFELPGRIDIESLGLALDRQAWLVSAGIAVAGTGAIALLAGLFAFTTDTRQALHARGGATARVVRRPLRTGLVAAQIAVTLVLVTGAGLFVRSVTAALGLNPGIDTTRIVSGNLSLAPYGYSPDRAAIFFDELRRRLGQSPSLTSVSIMRRPGGMGTGGKLIIDGAAREMPSFVAYIEIDEQYFPTMGLPVIQGRDFASSDTASSPLVIVVSESLGRFVANGGNPIGHRMTESSWRPPDPPAIAEIVGVVPDVITNVNATQPLAKYYAAAQRSPSASATLVFRASDVPSAIREATAIVRQMDPTISPGPMLTLDEQIGQQMSAQRFGIYVLGGLGGIALLLAALGTYVLAASMASRRRREMSVRAVLGASAAQLGGLLLRDTLRLVGIGLAAGLLLVWMGASTIRALLYRIEPLDPATLAAVSAIIAGLALLVTLRPAFDAARVDFTRALREE